MNFPHRKINKSVLNGLVWGNFRHVQLDFSAQRNSCIVVIQAAVIKKWLNNLL